jgi:N-acetylglucosamine-6-phosphate deacetylase
MKAASDDKSTAPRQLAGSILTRDGWIRGLVSFSGRILALEGEPAAGPETGLPMVLPGFIDLHVHGGGGGDMMSGREAIRAATRMHARHGTTCLLATTMTAGKEDLRRVFDAAGAFVQERAPGGARVLGIHLEGPFINSGKLGAQPDATRTGTLEEIRDLHRRAPIRVVTLAPELSGHMEFIQALGEMGIISQMGHTLASYETAVAAFGAGVRGCTHLFNAMTGLHHRTPGVVGAALALAEYSELIPDLLHVHPGAIRLALRAIPKLYCVTDATAGAGMPDGSYTLGSQNVTKCGCGMRMADGTLAGSTLTMDEALRNLVSLGLSVADASRRVSTYPADFIDAQDRGRIQAGCWADLVVLTPDLHLSNVFVEGEEIDLIDA